MRNFYDIKPIKAFIETDQIIDRGHNLHKHKESVLSCEVIGLSIYKGEVITAIVRLEDGTVFTYIPFHKLTTKTEGVNFEVPFEEVHFHNSPDFEISVNYMVNLAGYKVQVFNKFRGEWENDCRYHFTVDYVNDNMCLSLIEKPNGHLVWIPFHKMKFFSDKDKLDTSLKGFKKQRQTFRIV